MNQKEALALGCLGAVWVRGALLTLISGLRCLNLMLFWGSLPVLSCHVLGQQKA